MFKSIGSSKALLCVLAIVLLALNLRPPMAAIGPLLDMIHASTGLSHTEASLLTVLPVFMMGFCALLGKHLNHLFGERSGIAVGGLMIFMCDVKSLDSLLHRFGGRKPDVPSSVAYRCMRGW